MTALPSKRALRGQPVLLLAAGIVLLLLGGIVLAVAKGVAGNDTPDVAIGQAPDFTLDAFDGSSFHLADHANQPVLLYFWASWCEPCKSEAPLIQRLWQEYQAKGYTFVGMNIWDSDDDARQFASEYGLTFPVVRDRQNKVYLDYGVETLPMALFIKPGGEVDRRYIGQLKESDLRSMLDKLTQAPS
jgi:peroxiredoxin